MNPQGIFLLAATLLLAVGISEAQVEVHVGITTAYNSTFVIDKGIGEAPRYKSAITYNWSPIGISAGADFGRKFGLTLEGIVSNQGQKYDIIDIADKVVGQRSIVLKYFQVPLLMKFMNEGNAPVRGNFSLGPQISFLTSATDKLYYTASTQTFPAGAALPSGSKGILRRPDGNVQATVPAQSLVTVMSKEKGNFQKIDYQVVAAFGLDFDVARHLFLSLQLRGNYSLTDMRNDAAIAEIKKGGTNDSYGKRSSFLVGVQAGVHYVFGSTRSFKYKGSKPHKASKHH